MALPRRSRAGSESIRVRHRKAETPKRHKMLLVRPRSSAAGEEPEYTRSSLLQPAALPHGSYSWQMLHLSLRKIRSKNLDQYTSCFAAERKIDGTFQEQSLGSSV